MGEHILNMEYCEGKSHLTMNLNEILARKELRLYFQPMLNLNSGKINEVEALFHWEHPEKGVISSFELFALAEETGAIIQIGEWLMRKACEQNKLWQKMGLPSFPIAVCLSACQLTQPNFVESVQRILEETQLSPEYLELEITESIMMDAHIVLPILRELKRIGVQISLDDFGMGYCSLYYLKEFPIDKIKISRSFVCNCTTDKKDATLIKAIIAMAHQLSLEVAAKGIESKDQLLFLQQHLCNIGEGAFFSDPLLPNEFYESFYNIERIIREEGISPVLCRQKQLEEELENARQELRDTVSLQQGMIFKFVKENGKFIHTLCYGELFYRIGIIPEKLIGKELFDFFPKDVAEKKLQYYERAWAGEENVKYEGFQNGIWYLTSLRPVKQGEKIIEVICSSIDITERKKMEETLREREQKYRLIAENMQDLIAVVNTNGIILYASPSYETVLGFPPNVYEGNAPTLLVHPDDVSKIHSQYEHMALTKSPGYVEFRYQHAQNGWVYVESLGTPVLNGHGEVEHFVVVARDISKRKKVEELMRKSEKLSVVGQLAAGVAHEIRNPLTSIKGFVQLLRQEVNHSFYMDIIISEINRLESIVGEFLTLAKNQPPKRERLDLRILLQQVVSLFDTKSLYKNVEIIQEYDEGLPFIYCDGNQMKQVFMNIIKNAIEAMPNGGIIEIQISCHNFHSVRLTFIDQGVGISAERIKHIGEPYFSTKEKGTGLGLMISHKIVQEHGGTIHIESQVNKGTKVEVMLPIKQPSPVENSI